MLSAQLPLMATAQPWYICTAADSRFFNHVINLIGSIHKTNFDALGEIIVFNLGLSLAQKHYLRQIQKTTVHEIELVHPDLLKRFDTRPGGKTVPGWYAWKPVAIKQALEKHPYILWIDAGTTILQDIEPLFAHIRKYDYFFHNGCNIPIYKQITRYLIEKHALETPENNWILSETTRGLEAGLQGYTQKMKTTFVHDMYELSKDIRQFADDGTAPGGFGNARHDTSLYSVMAHLSGLHIHQHGQSTHLAIMLETGPFHITFDRNAITSQTAIYISRHDLQHLQVHRAALRR